MATKLDEVIGELDGIVKGQSGHEWADRDWKSYDAACDALYQLKEYRKFLKDEPKARVVPLFEHVDYCENCGKAMLDVYKYCPDCGKRLVWKGQNPGLWEKMGEKKNGK